ncbi:MAG: ThuA domain-containing protein [Tangfeifania sp.]
MKQFFLLVVFNFLFLLLNAQPVNVMLVTGGHSYDTIQFFQLFDSIENMEYDHFAQPEANKALAAEHWKTIDVLVFYDMWQNISKKEKQAYLEMTRQGIPMLFLHHALVSYQDWPEFKKIIGGKYVERSSEIPAEQQSTYKHDVWVNVEVVNPEHPVTEGFSDFRLFDEVYGNFRVSPGVQPLLKTDHPESTETIGWENKYNASNIVYLQPGHNYHAYQSDEYRKLISQAIHYLAQKNE